MLSKKIYEREPYKKTHTSKIIGIDEEKRAIILDETIFFPTGGGQDCDYGLINGVKVLDVFDEGGVVYHKMEHLRYFKLGNEVYGEIDFERRYDHMCQHTGEHILSGIVHKKYGFKSVGFHIGETVSRVDYDGYLDENMLKTLMDEANEAIARNYQIKVFSSEKDNIAEMEYRSKKKIDGEIRVVDCGVDRCACCAPHVHSTLEVGSIICVSNEKYKRGSRLMIMAKNRAYKYVNELMIRDGRLSAVLNSERSKIEEAVKGSIEKIASLEKKTAALSGSLIDKIYASFEKIEGDIVIYEKNLNSKQMMNLVRNLGNKRDGYVLGVFGEDKEELGFNLYYAGKDAKKLAENILGACTYKGGGKGENFQGKIKNDAYLKQILN